MINIFTQLRKKYKICPKKMLIRDAIKYIDKDKVTSDFFEIFFEEDW